MTILNLEAMILVVSLNTTAITDTAINSAIIDGVKVAPNYTIPLSPQKPKERYERIFLQEADRPYNWQKEFEF